MKLLSVISLIALLSVVTGVEAVDLRSWDRGGHAQMLMKIARNSVLSNTDHGRYLPSSWRTLYQLTKLSNERLEDLIDTGVIHPGLERKEVLMRLKDTPLRLHGAPLVSPRSAHNASWRANVSEGNGASRKA
jgi:hypothetical protein